MLRISPPRGHDRNKPKTIYYVGAVLAIVGGLCFPAAILTMIIGFLNVSNEDPHPVKLARSMALALSFFLASVVLFVIGVVLVRVGKPSEAVRDKPRQRRQFL